VGGWVAKVCFLSICFSDLYFHDNRKKKHNSAY